VEGNLFYSLVGGDGKQANLRGSKGHEVHMTLGHVLLYLNIRPYSILIMVKQSYKTTTVCIYLEAIQWSCQLRD
jgi:hypothetical protein